MGERIILISVLVLRNKELAIQGWGLLPVNLVLRPGITQCVTEQALTNRTCCHLGRDRDHIAYSTKAHAILFTSLQTPTVYIHAAIG